MNRYIGKLHRTPFCLIFPFSFHSSVIFYLFILRIKREIFFIVTLDISFVTLRFQDGCSCFILSSQSLSFCLLLLFSLYIFNYLLFLLTIFHFYFIIVYFLFCLFSLMYQFVSSLSFFLFISLSLSVLLSSIYNLFLLSIYFVLCVSLFRL